MEMISCRLSLQLSDISILREQRKKLRGYYREALFGFTARHRRFLMSA